MGSCTWVILHMHVYLLSNLQYGDYGCIDSDFASREAAMISVPPGKPSSTLRSTFS